MIFSNRLPPRVDANAISAAVAALRQRGIDFIDLTESNPTAAGVPYPPDLLAPLADSRGLSYEPHPFGLLPARQVLEQRITGPRRKHRLPRPA